MVSSDAALVLGAGIKQQQPSAVFQERINYALVLYKKDRVKRLIFTGGIGPNQTLAESEVAENYALQAGIKPRDIFIETRSTTSLENLREAKNIIHEKNIDRVLLISDPLHMRRVMTMAADLGINALPAPTPTSMYKTWPTQLKFLIREVYFYSAYLLYRNFI